MIYLDHAAATPVSPKAISAMTPYFADNFFNPSAPYLPAKKVREAYEKAKADLAHTIGAKGADLVITAGATESINLAFTAAREDGEVLYLATEHDSVKNTAATFNHKEIKVDQAGLIDLKDFQAKLSDKTTFVSVALVSSELGIIQPLAKIAELIKKERLHRLSTGNPIPLYFHTDASQALSLLEINVARLGIDLLTLNAAKVYGPKGIGALYVGHNVKLKPIVTGGGQEMGLRSGTENVPALVGFAVAAVEAQNHVAANRKKYQKLKQIFKTELEKKSKIPPLFLGHQKHQLANFCPVSLPGLDAERLIYQLEEKEIYVSTGAACAASKGKKSAALTAIGLTAAAIKGSLRITFGALNDEAQVKSAAQEIARLASEAANLPANVHLTAKKTVFLGMSGGVDSSVSALLLKKQGYQVVGAYMKNWSQDLPGMKCPWAEDLADAKRVATKLGIPFRIFDFEKDYKQKVVNYMLDEFKKGHTPNPDIMCNQEIKFKLFYEVARNAGADFIATGHYARIENGQLLRAQDENKDQTYFLYRISEEAISHTIFPIGAMQKPDVKKLAAANHLDNAYKKESMGVCFIGEVNIKDFLKQYLQTTPGPIIDIDKNEEIGTHEGAILYTIGQRKGLNIGGGLPYYVVQKDISKNILYVSRNLNNQALWTTKIRLQALILRPVKTIPDSSSAPHSVAVRLRHRGELIPATLKGDILTFSSPVKTPASGQSAVLYAGKNHEICLGGGIIV